MVPGAGLEPARLATRDFKSLVSTDFTTRAMHSRRLLRQSRNASSNETAPSTQVGGAAENLEARPGVEPGYTDLQSVA